MVQENKLLPLDRDPCSLFSPGAIMGCQLGRTHQGDTCSVSLDLLRSDSLCAAHIHLSLTKMEIWCLHRGAGTGRARDCGMMDPSRQLRGKTPPDLLPIPVAATEIHPKTQPRYQPFRELFLIHPAQDKHPKSCTLAFPWSLPGCKSPASWEHSRACPHCNIPAWNLQSAPTSRNFTGGNGIRAPWQAQLPAMAVGPCPTFRDRDHRGNGNGKVLGAQG